jgi:hypothetical protein
MHVVIPEDFIQIFLNGLCDIVGVM